MREKKQSVQPKSPAESGKRTRIRGMLLIYDSILYLLCWIAIFIFHPSMKTQLPVVNNLFYLVLGYVSFLSMRLYLGCYWYILRYGSMQAYAREISASLLGSILLIVIGVSCGKLFSFAQVPFISLIAFTAVYVIASLGIRIAYCYLYRFAERDIPVARFIRKVLERTTFVDFVSKKPGATLHLVLEPERNVNSPINELQNIVEKFAFRGDVTNITQINKGYINRTYCVETLSDSNHVHKYTLQRINTNVFPDVDALMENFKITTEHLHGRLALAGLHQRGAVQTIRPTKDGRAYLNDASGCWRMLSYFDDVYSLDIPDRPETFYHAGHAFGSFLKEMSDVDVSSVKTVIPNFHNTLSRYYDLEKSILRDPKGRVKNVQKEIEFVRARVGIYGIISEALETGKIPTRVCHNDCNLNNILFDKTTHLPVAIIDLDTVMPSSPLYDYGDSMRIGTNTAKDDEKDLSKVSCDLNLYEQYARGYLQACGEVLTKEELELLPYASIIITSEDGIRFLMDHIDGDTYYNIYYPGQNLDRSRTQLKLVEDMEKKLPEIKQILRKIYAELGLQAEIK